MVKTNSKNLKQAKSVLEQLIQFLGFTAQVEVKEDKEVLQLIVSSENPAFIIGYHGKTLSAIQTILLTIAYRRFGKTRIVVDVEGWRERREQTVIQLAITIAARAKEAGVAQPIYNLTPYERRIAHMALADDQEIETESQGEGKTRFLVVKLKQGLSDK